MRVRTYLLTADSKDAYEAQFNAATATLLLQATSPYVLHTLNVRFVTEDIIHAATTHDVVHNKAREKARCSSSN